MAIYKSDIVDINLETGSIHRSFLNHTIGSGDNSANRFGVRTFRDGVPADLSGASCQAVFMNAAGVNISLTSYGTVSGNEAYVTLPQACYNVEGQFCLAIKLVQSGVTVTTRIVDGVVSNTGTTGSVAPTSSVPTYQEILSTYDAMTAATAAANTAIAEEFDASENYPAGKNVINDGALYILPNGHTAGTTWANTTKVASNLGDQVTDLKSAIDDLSSVCVSKNLVGTTKDYLYLVPLLTTGDKITISTADGQAFVGYQSIKLYNAQKTQLISYTVGPETGTYRTITIDSDANGTRYIAISGAGTSILQIEIGDTKTDYVPYVSNPIQANEDVNERISNLDASIAHKTEVTVCKNLIGEEKGVLYAIPELNAGDVITISTSDGSNFVNYGAVKLYDASKTLLKSLTTGSIYGASWTVTLPEEVVKAVYISFSGSIDVPLQVEIGSTKTAYVRYFANNKDLTEQVNDMDDQINLIESASFGSVNLLGPVRKKLYIVPELHTGDKITLSTADGNAFPGYYGLSLYNTSKTLLQSYTVGTVTGSYRTITIDNTTDGTRYISVSGDDTPLQVQIGDKTAYEPYIPAPLEAYTELSDAIDYNTLESRMIQSCYVSNANYGTLPKNTQNLLTLLYFSDLHDDTVNLADMIAFKNKYADYINDAIHCGDSVRIYYGNENPFSVVAGGGAILNVVGNHDCWIEGETGYNATGAQVYAKLFEGKIGDWGVTQPTDAETNGYCYYYKDYSTNKFRLIVLDALHYDATQEAWFESVLDDAKDNSLAVIVAVHYQSETGITKFDCTFSSLDVSISPTSNERLAESAFNAVDDFIDAGGEFVCWICGHNHADVIGAVTGHTDQISIAIDMAGVLTQNGDAKRIRYTPSMLLFNVLSVDKTNKLIKIIRYGCDYDKYLRHKGTLCVKYTDKTIIANT